MRRTPHPAFMNLQLAKWGNGFALVDEVRRDSRY